MNRFLILSAMGLLFFLCHGCKEKHPLDTVRALDVNRYLGTWYEIARLPNSFEKDMSCCTATYSLRDDGKIKVLNKGYQTRKGIWKSAEGYAFQPNASMFPGQLNVTFFYPFFGDYYIFYLDDDYQHVMVGEPGRKYLWILSRDKFMEESTYQKLLDKALANHFDITRILKIDQTCNPE